jgi:uncharacterized membrane protein YedE/YeeE
MGFNIDNEIKFLKTPAGCLCTVGGMVCGGILGSSFAVVAGGAIGAATARLVHGIFQSRAQERSTRKLIEKPLVSAFSVALVTATSIVVVPRLYQIFQFSRMTLNY